MSESAEIDTALLQADFDAQLARPVSNTLFHVGAAIVALSLLLMVIGPWLTPYDIGRPSDEIMQPPPSLSQVPGLVRQMLAGAPHPAIHWLGTDSAGLDVFSRVLAAPRADVSIAVGANLFSLLVGSLLGLFAGTARPWVGGLTMRISDLVQAFPVFITGMILVTLAGRSNGTIVVTLALLYTPIYIRLTRSEVLTQRHRGFVDAARVLGKSEGWIALHHVLPNALAPAMIQASVTIGFAILMTAGLSFVGAGVRPPTPEWGLMIAAGADGIVQGEWWPSVFPGIAISITVFGYAAFGNGLERRHAR
ncbi:ABC transporter permease [Acidisphaera sp. L21]|uniref:ABC transporter permease n=1 Tax=Acidisphaera sp. L21 TaxID=1641851 RepID=UPI00131AF600|nr:ABC transporter permease [Acidisphaera sp. L21]